MAGLSRDEEFQRNLARRSWAERVASTRRGASLLLPGWACLSALSFVLFAAQGGR